MDAETRRALARIEAKLDEALARMNALRAAIGVEKSPLPNLVLTVEEAARRLQLPVAHVRALVRDGHFAPTVAGIELTEVEDYLGVPKAARLTFSTSPTPRQPRTGHRRSRRLPSPLSR